MLPVEIQRYRISRTSILGLNTGMRKHEMLFDKVAGYTVGLEWSRVDLQEGLIYLKDIHQKNGRVGSVPLNKQARAAILSRARFRAEHCPSSPWVFCNSAGEPVRSVRYKLRRCLQSCRY